MENDRTTTAPSRLRAGFVGAGFMAEVHSRAARAAGAEIAGIASSSAASAARAKDRLGVEQAYASFQDLVEDDAIDVIHVCTPNATHVTVAEAALAAGKHVVCEKPLATNVQDATHLVELAATAGKVATVPFVYRFHPMVREARDRIASGQTGRISTIQGSYLQDWLLSRDDDNWRVDAGLGGPSRAFADIGSHLCDLIEFVTNDRITRVGALSRTLFSGRANHKDVQTEDLVAAVFATETGTVGNLLVSQVAPGRKNRLMIEISGSESTVQFDQEAPETLWLGKRSGSQLIVRDPGALGPGAARLSVLPAGHPQGYQDAFNAFVADTYAAIGGESPEGLPTFGDGLRAAVLTESIIESSGTGQWIDVPAMKQLQGVQQ
jgi:predicted dehydrogenase